MKNRLILAAALLLLLLLAASCTGTRGNDPLASVAETGTDTEAAAEAETEVETGTDGSDTLAETDPAIPTETESEAPATPGDTEPETEAPVPVLGERIDLVAHTLTAADSKVTLKLTAQVKEAGLAGTVSLTLEDGDGVIARQSFEAAGGATVTFDCPEDRIYGALTVSGTVIASDGEILDEMTLKMKDGLPQLTPDGVRCVVAAMTAEEKAHMVTGVQYTVQPDASGGTYPIDRLGVPSITVNDGPAGVRYGTSVWYPSIINVSSSWDTALAERIGQSIGGDALALGIDIVLGPGMNIQKNVLGGRNFEYSSEDPILTALMVSPYVKGMQSTGAGACIKHFAVNNQESARGSVSANVTERALREIYLKAFGMVVADADPWTVMSSYNCLNGTHTSVNADLLTGILRGEFGFEGFVMSDWGAAGSMADKVNAMNDINMPGNATDPADVLAAYEAGLISDTALDACCYNILTVVVKSPTYLGLEMNTNVSLKEHHTVATEEAAHTMVLLQNENAALPLSDGTSVALFGNGAYKTVYGGAGSGSVNANITVSIYSGIIRASGLSVYDAKNNIFQDCDYHSAEDPSLDIVVTEAYAQEMAEGADVAVIVISRGSAEGVDRYTLKGDFLLNDTERDMINRVSAAFHAKGKQVVVVLNTGSPIEVVSWRDQVDAILWCGYAGQGTGTAVASVLKGKVNPSAKTTITWPVDYTSTPANRYFPGSGIDVTYYEDIYVGYRYYETFGVEVAYPFGYGLSYTTFAYSDYNLRQNADGTVTAWVTVTNTGRVAGREIVQLYVSKPETSFEQAKLELCGFAKTALLEPGASERVCIRVSVDAIKTYDTAGSRWILDQGDYTYSVGASSADLRFAQTVTLDALTVVQDVENRCEPDTAFDYIRKEDYQVPDDSGTRVNLALNKATWTNYSENESFQPDKAVDGDYISRWSGLGLSSGNHLWQVDLGQTYAIGEICISWESIHVPFVILLSQDGKTFTAYSMFMDDGSGVTSINLYGTEARYIRVDVTRGNAVSIYEFEVYEATEEDIAQGGEAAKRENLALGKTVTATTQEAAYMKEKAVDGDLTTRWGSLPSGEAWLQVDLGRVCHVDSIQLYLESAWVPWRIEYSVDGETYTTLRSCDTQELIVLLTDLDIDARFIRMWREGENWFSIYEVMVFGE